MSGKKQSDRKPFHVEFSEKVIKMLEEGTAPWQMPWHPSENLAPRNPLSGTVYRGVNRVALSMEGYNDPRWMTLKQANDAGYRVKRGEHSSTIVHWQFTREQEKLDANGQPIPGADGKPERETVELDRPVLRTSRVFNATQIEGFPALPETEKGYAWEPQEKAEKILENSQAVIRHDQRDRAFYTIAQDEIHLPPQKNFDQADKYYATALHELGHWTRAPHRLNRESGPFGSKPYAREELRAEISSWMVGQDIGVGHDPGQHAAYVQSWIQALRDDPLEILRACRDAEKIRDYVMAFELQKEQTLEQERQTQEQAMPAEEKNLAREKTWLNVPYREKDAVKALGARWDPREKSWYAPEGTDLSQLGKFLPTPERTAERSAPGLSPQEEFAEKLAAMGLDLKGQLPVLDGQLHRVPLLQKNGRGLDGSYCLHADGIPAGWAENHVTGERVKLVATGVTLSREEREKQDRERAARRLAAEHQRQIQHDANASRTQALWESFSPAKADSSPYLQRKGVEAFGIRQDQGNLIIPVRTVAGVFRGFQTIAPDGRKAFARGIEKKGNCHLIGADGKDLSRGEILLCEGYATGASLHMATGKPVAVAFDSGNLVHVAEAIRKNFPDAAITICADNDHAVTRDGKPYNVGLEKAKEAAAKVNGKVMAPTFSAREKARGLTDFNDLHQSRGLKEVKRQLGLRERGQSNGREAA